MQPPSRDISSLSRIDDSIATADSDHQTSLGYSNSLVLSQMNVARHGAARRKLYLRFEQPTGAVARPGHERHRLAVPRISDRALSHD
jgi:hypothetical protein